MSNIPYMCDQMLKAIGYDAPLPAGISDIDDGDTMEGYGLYFHVPTATRYTYLLPSDSAE